jgi:hypothetical protein
MPEPELTPEPPFDSTRRDAKRVQWALNGLVVFSALAGAVFFFYVLNTINPFGTHTAENVEVPTSAAGARYGLLTGNHEATGLSVALRDIDEAPDYRDKLSDTMRVELGISGGGRLYLLVIHNDGEAAVNVAAEQLEVTDKQGSRWSVKWLDQAAAASTAGPTGRLRLAQSGRMFELAKAAERQLYVFIEGTPPPAEDFASGAITLAGGIQISLTHTETRAQ